MNSLKLCGKTIAVFLAIVAFAIVDGVFKLFFKYMFGSSGWMLATATMLVILWIARVAFGKQPVYGRHVERDAPPPSAPGESGGTTPVTEVVSPR